LATPTRICVPGLYGGEQFLGNVLFAVVALSVLITRHRPCPCERLLMSIISL